MMRLGGVEAPAEQLPPQEIVVPDATDRLVSMLCREFPDGLKVQQQTYK